MKKFNPEKELSKIRNGNKKKIIISICALLVVGILGYSFALYQVRHTQKLVFNTVSEFKKRDIYLSVLVNGKTKNEFPGKEDGYAFSGYECDGDATVTFDPDKWMASVNSNGPDKCTIKFGPKNINYDMLVNSDEVEVDTTNDVNVRYYGINPANYIWFNCSDYTNQSEETCERWRIIGIMNNMTIVNEDTEEETDNQSLVKIIKNDRMTAAWDDNGTNDWYNATLRATFNDEDSVINETTKNTMIENVKWNIGGITYVGGTAFEIYKVERDTVVFNGRKTYWNGKVGLMYPSDYIFAVNGGTIHNREECLVVDYILHNKEVEDIRDDCFQSSWLYYSNSVSSDKNTKGQNLGSQWMMTPYSIDDKRATHICGAGGLCVNSSLKAGVRPVVYLKPSVQITGTGTYEEPYIINVE